MPKNIRSHCVSITLTAVAALTCFASSAARADDAPDFASTLTGDWGGTRTSLYNKGVSFDADYKADAWRNLSGGANTGNRVFDNLNIAVTVDGEKAIGAVGTSLFIHAVNNNGGKINDLTGSNGGIDNIEVSSRSFKIFEAYLQQAMFNDKVNVLVGLHDLNTEFYVTDTSGLFLNPTYGIGTEMAATGDNGPSVFPFSSLALRIAVTPTENTYIQAALYDGVPGTANSTTGTHIDLADKDGTLQIAEAGLRNDSIGHYGVGVWNYTAKRPDQVTASEKVNSKGLYLLGEKSVMKDGDKDISVFARVGFTAGDVEQFRSNWSLGVVGTGIYTCTPDGQWGLAVSQNRNADKYKQANAGAESSETQWEITYSDKLLPWLTLQPDLQYTVNPGTDATLDNAWTIGLRTTIDF